MSEARLRILLAGDVMTGRGVDQVLPHPCEPHLYERWVPSALDYVRLAERKSGPIARPVDFGYVWGEALQARAQRAPDLAIVNLETSITASEAYVPKGINYRMHPRNAPCLAALAPDACVLANNHVLDWGEAGLLDTLRALAGLGVRAVGAGRDAAAAADPAVFAVPGKGRVIVVGLCTRSSGVADDWAAAAHRPGVNLVAPTPAVARALAARLAGIRRAGDVVVASIHWGPNWGYDVPLAHRAFARALIEEAGVSIVHGHSSHHPLAIEPHHGRLILYGCGDLLSDYEGIGGHEEVRPDLAVMYFADVLCADGRLAALELAPFKLRRFRLNAPADDEVDWLRARLDRESRRFGAGVERRGRTLSLVWPGAVVA
jgi:poly-gamma-glutamate synthesis protein (capsule biosynthesis protein)